jgi:hypothetical protein
LGRGETGTVECTWLYPAAVTNVVLEAETPLLDPLNILPFEAAEPTDETVNEASVGSDEEVPQETEASNASI